MHYSSRARGVSHFAGLVKAQRQRLFDNDMLAPRDSGQRDGMVHPGGRYDVNYFNGGIIEQILISFVYRGNAQ
jgi:hypothetical protein